MTYQISAPGSNALSHYRMSMDSIEIQKIIPHRPPFLLIDEIVELQPGKRAVGTKNVTADEWFFQGHFPGYPIMPGVLIIEALAQTGAVVILSLPEHAGKIVLFARIDKVKFKREVKPGDRLLLEVDITRWRGKIGKGLAQATVNGELVAEAELTFSVK
ncbi:MAG: 3-hydroxyacyl-ACP dehydratase FabZ [Actinomycetota bacterium]|nr:3-hydroxyacyl-ACP dehydratase FabZ [Actinomycetota bacterium]